MIRHERAGVGGLDVALAELGAEAFAMACPLSGAIRFGCGFFGPLTLSTMIGRADHLAIDKFFRMRGCIQPTSCRINTLPHKPGYPSRKAVSKLLAPSADCPSVGAHSCRHAGAASA